MCVIVVSLRWPWELRSGSHLYHNHIHVSVYDNDIVVSTPPLSLSLWNKACGTVAYVCTNVQVDIYVIVTDVQYNYISKL